MCSAMKAVRRSRSSPALAERSKIIGRRSRTRSRDRGRLHRTAGESGCNCAAGHSQTPGIARSTRSAAPGTLVRPDICAPAVRSRVEEWPMTSSTGPPPTPRLDESAGLDNEAVDTYPPLAYAWYVVGVLTVAYVVSFVDRQILSLLAEPIERDLGIGDTAMSLLMGFSFAVFYTIFGIPLGRLADSRSRRAIIAVGIASWSLMTAGCGL